MRKYALMFALLFGCASGQVSSMDQGGSGGSNQESQGGNSDTAGSNAGGSVAGNSQGGNNQGGEPGSGGVSGSIGSGGSSAGGSTQQFTKAHVTLVGIPPFTTGTGSIKGSIDFYIRKGDPNFAVRMTTNLGGPCGLVYYQVAIMKGTDCPIDVKHIPTELWDAPRGGDENRMMCDPFPLDYGHSYMGSSQGAYAWTIGDGGPTDIIGHIMTIFQYSPNSTGGGLSCGIIEGVQ